MSHCEIINVDGNFDTAVIFVHGILGSPNQFKKLTEICSGKCAIFNLLIPGHGHTGKEFASSGMEKWQAYVDEKLHEVQSKYEKIILVGHSMGCLLLTQSAINSPEKVCGLMFLAIPLKIHMNFSCVKTSVKVAFNLVKEDDLAIKNSIELYSIQQKNIFGYLNWIPCFVELLKKSRKTRDIVNLLVPKVVIFQSENDEVVSIKSLKYLKSQENFEITTFKKSAHYIFEDTEQKQILERFEQMTNEVINQK